MKWPCTVRGGERPQPPHSGSGGSRLSPSCWHPDAVRGEVSGLSLKDHILTPLEASAPRHYSVLPLLADSCSHLQGGRQSPVVLSPGHRVSWHTAASPQLCPPWAAASWNSHWVRSCVLVSGGGRLCPMDISVKWGISLSELGLVTVKTSDTKENGREPVFPLLWKQVLRAFWGKCASCLGNRPSYSLPLAWHEINCSSALRVSEGRTTPIPRVLLLGPPSSHQMACGAAYVWEPEVSGSGSLH